MAKSNSICSIEGCGKKAYLRGWCSPHYQRWRRYGSPYGGGTMEGAPAAFLGQVLSSQHDDECAIWPYGGLRGYGMIKQGKKPVYVHRIVCEAVNGPPPSPKHEAAHSCGKGGMGCVNPNHLRWASKLENNRDMIAHGTMPRGEKSGRAKLTENDVRKIRSLDGQMLNTEIASMFGVAPTTISSVLKKRNWKWLT